MKIVNLVPDAFFSARDDISLHPVCRAIKQAVAALRIHIRFLLCIAQWNDDFSNLSFFGDAEYRLLVMRFDRLHPAGICKTFIVDLIPHAIERIPLFAVLIYGSDIHDFIAAEVMYFVGGECRPVKKRDAAQGDTAMFRSEE